MPRYLKLVGTSTYNSKSTGPVRNGDIITIQDDERADALLEKGELKGDPDDNFFKPHFVEVKQSEAEEAAPAVVKARRLTRKEVEELAAKEGRQPLTAAQKPQAPVGPGENQAESEEPLNETESEDEGAKDSQYHEGQGEEGADDNQGEEGTEGEGEEGSAAPRKVARTRAPKAAAK